MVFLLLVICRNLQTHLPNRYIEQYQSLLTSSPTTGVQRNDLELYWSTVRAGAGDVDELLDETSLETVNIAYVQGTAGPTEAAMRIYYEKWLSDTG